MALSQWVTDIRNNILTTIKDQLEAAWLAHREDEINRSTQRDMQSRRAQLLATYRYNPPPESALPQHIRAPLWEPQHIRAQFLGPRDRVETRVVDGGTIRSDRYGDYERQLRSIENQIRTTYTQAARSAFNMHWTSTLQPRFHSATEALRPDDVKQALFARHPWLKEDGNFYAYGLTKTFITDFIRDKLLSTFDCGRRLNRWGDIDRPTLDRGQFTWRAFDFQREPTFQSNIDGYPFAPSVSYSRTLTGYPCLSERRGLTHHLTRVDMFRFLHKSYQAQMQSTEVGGIYTPKLMPLGLSEVEKLMPAQFQHTDVLLVDLNEREGSEEWLLLHKMPEGNGFRIYLPQAPLANTIAARYQTLTEALTAKGLAFEAVTVDYNHNLTNNDITGLNDTSVWQAIMLGRLLPGCMEGVEDLSTYHATTPVSLFLQKVLPASHYTYLHNSSSAFAKCFGLRAPFSRHPIATLLNEYFNDNALPSDDTLFDAGSSVNSHLSSSAHLDNSLSLLGNGGLTLSGHEDDYLTLNMRRVMFDANSSHDAMSLLYQQSIPRLVMRDMPIDKAWFDYACDLEIVTPASGNNPQSASNIYYDAWMAAARNRFLKKESSETIDRARTNPIRRKCLWRDTGQVLLNFYREHGAALSQTSQLDLLRERSAEWKQNRFDYPGIQFEEPGDEAIWSAAQLAQMGTQGLDVLFRALEIGSAYRWNAKLKSPKPNLPLVLDLQGRVGLDSADYIRYFRQKVRNFDSSKRGAAPLFESLTLLLPNAYAEDRNLEAVSDLMRALDTRYRDNAEDTHDVNFHGLDINSPASIEFIETLELLAEERNLCIQVHIPTWDEAAFETPAQREVKARYKALQNRILENQRLRRAEETLEQNLQAMTAMYEYEGEDIEADFDDALFLEAQPFGPLEEGEDDPFYPLASSSLGIQQQQQQQQEAQQEQEQEQEQEEEQEQEQEIGIYAGDERLLVTRDTIHDNARCQRAWTSTPEAVKALSGHQNNHLGRLFSLWVGSAEDATHVIRRIEPKAVERIMSHAPQFRFGISKDNLPPGFYLATGRREADGLILCFDKEREQEALHDLEAKSIEERNPFTLTLYEAKPKQAFSGDFRQFHYVAEDTRVQQALWKHCAYEEVNEVRRENARGYLDAHHAADAVSDEDISPVMQFIDAENACVKPADFASSLNSLSDWARALIFVRDEDEEETFDRLLTLLFNTTEESSIKPEQLKAFGQLFHAYESGVFAAPASTYQPDLSGEHPFIHARHPRHHAIQFNTGLGAWLRVGYEVLDQFGEAHFNTWKKHVVDSSNNWTECLDASEMNALAISMMKLRGKPELTALWFDLLDKHGSSTGQVRYSKLWHAFERVLKHIEKKRLNLDISQMQACFEACGDNFNGIVLLDRMRYTLRKATRCAYPDELQQVILNHVADIDWRHNGYYYAARYNNHSYWDEDLWLRDFERTRAYTAASYDTRWPAELNYPLQNAYVHALRFASGRMGLTYGQFQQFKDAILPFNDSNLSDSVLRLMTASRAIGVDTSAELARDDLSVYAARLAATNPQVLRQLNAVCVLDAAGLSRGTLQMRFGDMVAFAESCTANSGLLAQFRGGAYSYSSLEVLNHYGRALDAHAFLMRQGSNPQVPTDETKRAFIKTLSTQNRWIISAFPWLVGEPDVDALCDLVKRAVNSYSCGRSAVQYIEQLRTIDYRGSSCLPTVQSLTRHFLNIIRATDPGQERIECVKELLRTGCMVRQQDAGFIPLPEDDKEPARVNIVPRLKRIFSAQNAPLCQTFLDQYVAVPVRGSADDHMAPLLDLLVQIDNKPHYNELGQLLGLLIKKAKAVPEVHGKKYYSAPQLVEWLRALMDDERYHNTHYPLSLLEALLDAPVLSSVLNEDLNQLTRRCDDYSLLRRVEHISTRPIPNQYKPVLIKLVLEADEDLTDNLPDRAVLLLTQLSSNGASRQYLQAVNRLLEHFGLEENYEQAGVDDLLESLCVVNPQSEAVQIFLIENYINQKLSSADILRHFRRSEDADTQSWQCVFGYALQKTMAERREDQPLAVLQRVKNEYTQWVRQLEGINAANARYTSEQLARYYEVEPRPSLSALSNLFRAEPVLTSVDALIHRFETVEQGLKPSGEEKRHYSVTADEREALNRVLDGFKCKRKGGEKGFLKTEEQNDLLNLLYYTNQYAQVQKLRTLTLEEVHTKWANAAGRVRTAGDIYASAEMLACQREILLRKTGMWANHTQMLAELYAAVYKDESLIYQMKTGQGKSILTALRVSFLAGTGRIVDSFSSKESLSSRDHEDFAPYLDALGIRHSYIKPNSPAECYHARLQNNIGAVNYMTPSNFSLFQAGHIWKGEHDVPFDKAIRVAFLDEADHILLDEQTQANFASGSEESVYNFDEWVYREAYEFFLENKASFISKTDRATPGVYRHEHLEPLCRRLQEVAKHAPRGSQFVQKYIVPALSGNEADIKKRDEKLKQLMTAAFTANKLKDGPDFCKRPVYKNIGGVDVRTHFAKVVIKNQVRDGSTYSDLVQQFLHTRLNREAVRAGEKPDFFIEPSSEIALSQNVLTLMRKYYAKIEGCTGTAGSESDLRAYIGDYGIDHVVKLPTHEQLVSEYESGVYADSEEAQVTALVAATEDFAESGPILITCEDDIAVKRFAELLQARQAAGALQDIRLIIDTNDSGRSEKDILPIAGNTQTVVISSRMGRGTDIRPQTEAGLKVIRTYAAIPRVTKQEFGRQGRNGHPGRCQEILNYGSISDAYDYWNEHGALDEIYAEETVHLNRKLVKHDALPKLEVARPDGSTWVKPAFERLNTDEVQKACYLRTRTLVRFKHELKLEQDSFLRQREAFNAKCSEAVKDALHGARSVEPNPAEREVLVETLKEMFITARKDMDALWNMRLQGGNVSEAEACAGYLAAAEEVWQGVVVANERLLSVIPDQEIDITPRERMMGQVRNPDRSIAYAAMTRFYQGIVASAEAAYFDNQVVGRVPELVIPYIYGRGGEAVAALYQAVREIGEQEAEAQLQIRDAANHDEDVDREVLPGLIFDILAPAAQIRTSSLISCSSWQEVIALFDAHRTSEHFAGYGECLTAFLEKAWLQALLDNPEQLTVDELEKVSALFRLTMKSIFTAFIDDATPRFVGNLTEVVHEHLWDTFTGADGEILETLFCSNEAVTRTLMMETNQADLGRFITLFREAAPERRAALLACLEEQSDELVDSSEALRAVFELILGGEQCADEPLERLPQSLNLLPDMRPAIRARLWHFLTQRPDITREGIHRITQPLAEHNDDAALAHNVLEPLLQVPSYVPLQYVADQTRFTMGAHTLDPCRQRLESVRVAGEAFSEFLVSRGVIQSAHEYMRIEEDQQEAFDTWQQNFSNLTPQQNQVFFEMAAAETTLEMDTIQSLYESYESGGIPSTRRALAQAMVAMRVIEIEIQDRVARQSLRDAWNDNRLQNMQQLQDAVNVAKKVEALKRAQNWDAYFKVLRCTKAEDRRAIIQHLSHGIFTFGDAFDDSIFDAYLKLMQSLKWIFIPEEGEDVVQRHQKMRANYAAIIEMTKELAAIVKPPYRTEEDEDYDNEAPCIADPALGESVVSARNASTHLVLQNYVKGQEARYAGYWWVNQARRKQARDLFGTLSRIAGIETTDADFFGRSLQVIVRAEHALLLQDERSALYDNYRLNTKGYSRLYHIMDEMFVTLAKEMFKKKHIRFEEKLSLKELLDNQLQFQLTMLIRRLPAETQVRRLMMAALRDGETAAEQLNLLLTHAERKDIPSDLHYLLDNLECLEGLTRSLSEEEVRAINPGGHTVAAAM